MPKYYPGWIMRLYYDLDNADPVFQDLCNIACDDVNIDICDVNDLPGTPMVNANRVFPMYWRIFPTLDPQVEVVISRDLDSLFSDREYAAVQEWLQSDDQFHIMRDHPYHGVSILAGMWGSRLTNPQINSKWQDAWNEGFKDDNELIWVPRESRGQDQLFLDK